MLLACPRFCRPVLIVLLLDVLCQVFVPSEFVFTEVAFVQGGAVVHLGKVPQQGRVVPALEVKGAVGVLAVVTEIWMLLLYVGDQALVGFEVQVAFFAVVQLKSVNVRLVAVELPF